MLAEKGVDAAHWAAWAFEPERVEAVVRRWEERRAEGEELGPGWIIWRLKEGGPIAETPVVEEEMSWAERRWRHSCERLGKDPDGFVMGKGAT